MEMVIVLGYGGVIRKGNDGYYIDFGIRHKQTVGLIAKKLGILNDRANLDTYIRIFWDRIFTKLTEYHLGKVCHEGHIFPEFQQKEGLLKFISLINNNFNNPDPNFINIENFV